MSLHHSRESREHAVPCVRCKKPTLEFDRRCDLCTIAVNTPPTEDTYFSFDLEKERVLIEEFRLNPEQILAECLAGLER